MCTGRSGTVMSKIRRPSKPGPKRGREAGSADERRVLRERAVVRRHRSVDRLDEKQTVVRLVEGDVALVRATAEVRDLDGVLGIPYVEEPESVVVPRRDEIMVCAA
jgi:hypothetical protein